MGMSGRSLPRLPPAASSRRPLWLSWNSVSSLCVPRVDSDRLHGTVSELSGGQTSLLCSTDAFRNNDMAFLTAPPPLPFRSLPSPQVIIAEPYPPPPSEALYSNPTTFVAAFAMPNTTIPNNTDLRNFLVPLEALESVSGLRFLGAMDAADAPGAPASATSGGSSGEEAAIKEFLDQEAIRLRAKAGVPALSGDWGRVGVEKKGNHSGKRSGGNGKRPQLSIGGADGEGRTRVFRHLCNTTSCRGL